MKAEYWTKEGHFIIGNNEFDDTFFSKRPLLHRDNGPAVIKYYSNGNKKHEYYMQEANFHRDDGPAITDYEVDGSLKKETWYKNCQLHRDNNPATISYIDNKIFKLSWYNHNELHNTKGPAQIMLNIHLWYLNGKSYKLNEWLEVNTELTPAEKIYIKLKCHK